MFSEERPWPSTAHLVLCAVRALRDSKRTSAEVQLPDPTAALHPASTAEPTLLPFNSRPAPDSLYSCTAPAYPAEPTLFPFNSRPASDSLYSCTAPAYPAEPTLFSFNSRPASDSLYSCTAPAYPAETTPYSMAEGLPPSYSQLHAPSATYRALHQPRPAPDSLHRCIAPSATCPPMPSASTQSSSLWTTLLVRRLPPSHQRWRRTCCSRHPRPRVSVGLQLLLLCYFHLRVSWCGTCFFLVGVVRGCVLHSTLVY